MVQNLDGSAAMARTSRHLIVVDYCAYHSEITHSKEGAIEMSRALATISAAKKAAQLLATWRCASGWGIAAKRGYAPHAPLLQSWSL